MENNKLKECPFCGGSVFYSYENGEVGIECVSCDLKMKGVKINKQWNNRPLEKKQADKIEQLETRLKNKDDEIKTLKEKLDCLVEEEWMR